MLTIIAFVPLVRAGIITSGATLSASAAGESLEVGRDEYIHVGFEQGVVKVEQEGDGHGGSGGAAAGVHAIEFSNCCGSSWVLFLHFKYRWKRMAFPTADVRVETGPSGLFTKSGHLHTPLECGCQRAGNFAAQLHEFAGIRHDRWTGPGRCGTGHGSRQCRAGGIPHGRGRGNSRRKNTCIQIQQVFSFEMSAELPQVFEPAGAIAYTRVRYSPVRVSTRMVSPSLTKFGHCTSKPVSTLLSWSHRWQYHRAPPLLHR